MSFPVVHVYLIFTTTLSHYNKGKSDTVSYSPLPPSLQITFYHVPPDKDKGDLLRYAVATCILFLDVENVQRTDSESTLIILKA